MKRSKWQIYFNIMCRDMITSTKPHFLSSSASNRLPFHFYFPQMTSPPQPGLVHTTFDTTWLTRSQTLLPAASSNCSGFCCSRIMFYRDMYCGVRIFTVGIVGHSGKGFTSKMTQFYAYVEIYC